MPSNRGNKRTEYMGLTFDSQLAEEKRLNFTIPGKPPTENHMWFKARGKAGNTINIYKTDAKRWFMNTREEAQRVAEAHNWIPPIKHEWVVVRLFFYFPNRNHPDPSNCLKAFLDALEGPIYVNDKWVLPQIVGVDFDKENPRTEVEVFPLW